MSLIPTYAITSVVTPPAGLDLTTLAIWKDDWGVKGNADDAFIRRTITRCSMAAANYCNRVFGIATYLDVIRLERGEALGRIANGEASPIAVRMWPLVSILSVTENPLNAAADLTEGTDFETDLGKGLICRLDGNGNPRTWPMVQINVVYQAGYVLPTDTNEADRTLPFDIEDAVGRMVWSRYAERQRDPFVQEESVVGVGTTRYITTTPDGNLSPDVTDILNNYRVPLLGGSL